MIYLLKYWTNKGRKWRVIDTAEPAIAHYNQGAWECVKHIAEETARRHKTRCEIYQIEPAGMTLVHSHDAVDYSSVARERRERYDTR